MKTSDMWLVAIVAIALGVAGWVWIEMNSRRAPPGSRAARAMLLAIAGAQRNESPYVGSAGLAFCPPQLDRPMVLWPTACQSRVWLTLGVPRPNQTRYQYAIAAGTAAQSCDYGPLICASVAPGERWWVAVAHGDLDGDGVRSTFITSYSMNGAIYTANEFE